jgi:hypothetical protein
MTLGGTTTVALAQANDDPDGKQAVGGHPPKACDRPRLAAWPVPGRGLGPARAATAGRRGVFAFLVRSSVRQGSSGSPGGWAFARDATARSDKWIRSVAITGRPNGGWANGLWAWGLFSHMLVLPNKCLTKNATAPARPPRRGLSPNCRGWAGRRRPPPGRRGARASSDSCIARSADRGRWGTFLVAID